MSGVVIKNLSGAFGFTGGGRSEKNLRKVIIGTEEERR